MKSLFDVGKFLVDLAMKAGYKNVYYSVWHESLNDLIRVDLTAEGGYDLTIKLNPEMIFKASFEELKEVVQKQWPEWFVLKPMVVNKLPFGPLFPKGMRFDA